MKRLLHLIFLLVPAAASIAAEPDNIVIVSADESYSFRQHDGNWTVDNRISTEYEATRMPGTVVSQAFYSDRIKLDKASGKGKADYRHASSDHIFHDDSRLCTFVIGLDSKGKKTKTEFRRTFTDPVYFTKIPLADIYPIRHKTVTITVPAEITGITVRAFNAPATGVNVTETTGNNGERIFRCTTEGLPAIHDEPARPAALTVDPYLLIGGWFADVAALYRWEHDISTVDCAIPESHAFLNSIVSEGAPDGEKIDSTLRWIQRNIRYIAYEEGDAGHRPDTPAEVIRKRYGDCKGMAVLLATLLQLQGLDASPASVGTRDVPFKIAENPSLAAADHFICVVNPASSAPLYLDPTARHTPAGHIPYSISGKDVLVHRGDGYLLLDIPESVPESSTDELRFDYTMTDGKLTGAATRRFSGDFREWFMQQLEAVRADRHKEALATVISPHDNAGVSTESISLTDNRVISIDGKIMNTRALSESDERLYVDLNTDSDPFTARIDTLGRVNDFMLPFPAVIRRIATMTIPSGLTVTYLPENFSETTPQGTFSCTFAISGNTVSMTKTAVIAEPRIKVSDLPAWNASLLRWADACNSQIEFSKSK